MPRWLIVLNVSVLIFVAGCAALSAAVFVEQALGMAEQRREFFEATLDVLDVNPDYVDEFFDTAEQHRASLDRLLQNAADALGQPALAEVVSTVLSGNPVALTELVGQTLDRSLGIEGAEDALGLVLGSRGGAVAGILAGNPDGLMNVLTGTLQAAVGNGDAQTAVVNALGADTEVLAQLVGSQPQSLTSITEALLREGMETQPDAVLAMVRGLGLDTATPPPVPEAPPVGNP